MQQPKLHGLSTGDLFERWRYLLHELLARDVVVDWLGGLHVLPSQLFQRPVRRTVRTMPRVQLEPERRRWLHVQHRV